MTGRERQRRRLQAGATAASRPYHERRSHRVLLAFLRHTGGCQNCSRFVWLNRHPAEPITERDPVSVRCGAGIGRCRRSRLPDRSHRSPQDAARAMPLHRINLPRSQRRRTDQKSASARRNITFRDDSPVPSAPQLAPCSCVPPLQPNVHKPLLGLPRHDVRLSANFLKLKLVAHLH